MDKKFDQNALQSLSEDERRQLLRQLVDTDQHRPVKPGTSWKWDLLLVVIIGGCILLAAWIGYLAVSLPAFYRAGSWRGAWVGFDVAELVAFATTGWAAWKRRQILIICLIVLATLLLCDAWFDVVLDARTSGFLSSLVSALVIEVPIAVIAVLVARRLLRLTVGQVIKYEGGSGPVPSLWKIPLFGPEGQGTPLERLIRAARADGETQPEVSDQDSSVLWPEVKPDPADETDEADEADVEAGHSSSGAGS
ncbi:MAG TPA: hypothetical protein VF979_04095 [Streptosporangiaceae bacterium]